MVQSGKTVLEWNRTPPPGVSYFEHIHSFADVIQDLLMKEGTPMGWRCGIFVFMILDTHFQKIFGDKVTLMGVPVVRDVTIDPNLLYGEKTCLI